jgi:amino acid adenylation domain-containing protein
VLTRDIIFFYNSFFSNALHTREPLRIQYKDYAAWQNSLLEKENVENHRAYWLNALGGELPVLHLPLDHPRPKMKGNNGDIVSRRLNKQLQDAVYSKGREIGGSVFMVLLATVKVLLHRYTGQDDIVVGSSVAGREHVDLENQIGCYVNMLPLRSTVTGNDSFDQLLRRIKETTLEAYAHQIYPFDKLVDELELPRDLSRMPVFDVLVELYNMDPDTKEMETLRDVAVLDYERVVTTSKFDLSFNFRELNDGILLELEYNTDLFLRESIESMLDHYISIVENLLQDGSCEIGKINYLSPADLRILEQFNSNQVPYPTDLTVVELIAEQARKAPRDIAVICGENSITYKELDEQSAIVAAYIKRLNLQEEQVVTICMDRCIEMMVAILGVWKAGHAYSPLSRDYPSDRISYILSDLGSPLVITTSANMQLFGAVDATEIACIDTQWDLSGYSLSPYPRNEAHPGALAYVIYTSGSTGQPKGAMIAHTGMLNHLYAKINDLHMNKETVVAQTASVVFDISVWQMWGSLLCGGRTIIYLDELILSPIGLAAALETDNVTIWGRVPSYLASVLSASPAVKLPSLAYLITTGEAIDPSMAAACIRKYPGVRMVNAYGPTEAADDICHYMIDKAPENKIVPVGKPVQNMRIYILNDQRQMNPVAIKGEICVSGPGVGRGYWRDKERTNRVFIPDPFTGGGAMMYCTGDTGRWRRDGNIEYLGRKDDQIKLRGYRIELGEIEKVMSSHKDVASALVVAGGKDHARYITGYYKGNSSLGDEVLREYLERKLPDYMIPAYLVKLESFPLLPNGKIDRRKLPDPVEAGIGRATYVAPRNETEELILDIFKQVLERDNIGIKDDFFMIGGTSMSSMQIISKVEMALGVKLSMKNIFENSNVIRLSKLVESAKMLPNPLFTKPFVKTKKYPLSSIQKRFWIVSQTEDASCAYNVCSSILISGELNQAILKQSFNLLLEKHEILRTHFVWDDADIVQSVRTTEEVNFDFEHLDASLKGKTGMTNIEVVADEVAAERERPFDFESLSPLFRVKLIYFAPRQYAIIFTIHHIICDATSLYLIFRELVNFYTALKRSGTATFEPLPFQYKDYAVWEKTILDTYLFGLQRDYWNSQFEDKIPVLGLETDYPAPENQTFRGSAVELELPMSLSLALKKYALQQQCSPFMFLFASLNLLLNKYIKQEDIVVGVTISTRLHKGSEDQIGPYINTLPVRTKFHAYERFEDLMGKVRTNLLNAFEYQEYPLDMLINDLNVESVPGHTPFFDIIVSYRDIKANEQKYELDDIRFESVEIGDTTSQFPLTIDFFESDDRIWGIFNYNTDLFRHVSMEIMKERYIGLMEHILQAPDSILEEIGYGDRFENSVNINKIEFDY